MNRTDTVADALRHKDAEQRGTPVLGWKWLTDSEKTKWRELALVAAAHFAKPRARRETNAA